MQNYKENEYEKFQQIHSIVQSYKKMSMKSFSQSNTQNHTISLLHKTLKLQVDKLQMGPSLQVHAGGLDLT